jgi:hypothetical protein
MAENKYKQTDTRIKAARKEGAKDHTERKNPGMRDKYAAQRKETNAARGKQVWVESSFKGTLDELDRLTDDEVLAIVPAHWERASV